MKDTIGTSIELKADDFKNKIFFVEDIVEYVSPEQFGEFFGWLGTIGALENLKGIIIGKFTTYKDTGNYNNSMLSVINGQYDLNNLPILANMNFGHTSPIFILPFGALAEINCDNKTIKFLESATD
jgi:muramoyltetrapeptide carboxypeptidase LdcA involved in peptidoglycan recycling